jgi:hypothetical protein
MPPIHPVADVSQPQSAVASLLARLSEITPKIVCSAPDQTDAGRWIERSLGGRVFQIAQPVSFTPYASAVPCPARCRFCSELLIEKNCGKPAAALRPGENYANALDSALSQLIDLPLSYSLSGLETTADPTWMTQLLGVLQQHARRSPVLARTLCTNAAGLADPTHGEDLIRELIAFGFNWIEVSRQHFDEAWNQAIMRFHPNVTVRHQQPFERVLGLLAEKVPVKLVCVVQRYGIGTPEDLTQYLDWAIEQGVGSVVFREFSKFDERYAYNITAHYIAAARLPLGEFLERCLTWAPFSDRFEFERTTEGYYFWNLTGRYRGLEVVFEASDYSLMHKQHDSGRVYKMVFHANGNLCAGWNPQRHVLLQTGS